MNKLAIMMRVLLNGESLNNEGNIGNVMISREVNLCDGTTRQALSGEMLKHYHTRNLRLLAENNELCDTCKIFSPMKNGIVREKDVSLSESGNKVKECIVDDIEGFMNAGENPELKKIKLKLEDIKLKIKEDKKNQQLKDEKEKLELQIKNVDKNAKRTSCVKFSWGIATSDNESQTMLHNRVDVTDENNKTKEERKSEGINLDDANTIKEQNTQMIFYRPIRSNEYAITCEIELDRIGFDDEKLIYTLSEDEIENRKKKCLQAFRNMFIDMEGALCSTRLPHIMNIEGVIVQKTDKNDVLVKYSALNDDYKEVNTRIGTNTKVFNNIEEFVKVMDEIK